MSTDPHIVSEFCRMVAEAVDELERADTDWAHVEIRLRWPTEPREQLWFPVETVRSATWVDGEWKGMTYQRKETQT